MAKIRVLRVLEYEGDEAWVRKTLSNETRWVNGTRWVGTNRITESFAMPISAEVAMDLSVPSEGKH